VSKPDAAQLIAALALGALAFIMAIVGPKQAIATSDLVYTDGAGNQHSVTRGAIIPADVASALDRSAFRWVRRTPLGAILAGADHRTSTSKTVVFAWTLAVAFGLLSLLIAIWLGDRQPWDKQVANGLQEEYLLVLGGPYAAAVLAKYVTSKQADAKPSAAPGDAKPSQLVTNDEGNTDLGDFQYVLFNALGIILFLSEFVGHLDKGFPSLPQLLTGLMLTSTGGYGAKKLLAQAVPTLISVMPRAAKNNDPVEVFAMNLSLPAADGGTGEEVPLVYVGGHTAQVSAHDLVLGNDRLTVTVPEAAGPGPAPITVVRADGVPARDAHGVTQLPFEVLPTPT